MGAFDKQKKEIKRELKRQKTDMSKAKKMAEALLVQLEGVEGRFNQTEEVLDQLPGTDIENVFKQLRDGKDTPQARETLLVLAQRLISPTRDGMKSRKAGSHQSDGRVTKRPATRRGGPVTMQLGIGRGSKTLSKAGSRTTKTSSKAASNKSAAKAGRQVAPSTIASSNANQSDEEGNDSNDGAEDMEQD